MSKFRVCWHKIAHLATSRWHRTEQHAIERSKYRVGLQDASQAQLKAQTDKKDTKDAICYPCTSFFMFDTKSVGILPFLGGGHWGQTQMSAFWCTNSGPNSCQRPESPDSLSYPDGELLPLVFTAPCEVHNLRLA